ncbi:MAG: hydrogenase iron-sulfur subunit [Candidatus Lokiarchaeota archaeon]|nr:hydrogenase iron-sulfur subunit [Candidatus Lokiarchaeota archaeon]
MKIKILAFICNWCANAASESAGIHRLHYPANIRFIKLPCTGRLDSIFIYDAFLNGIDGVMIFACKEGDCHHINGNIMAYERIGRIKRCLELVGFEKERLEFIWISANEPKKFQESIMNFFEVLTRLGPNKILYKNKGSDEKINEC